MPSNPTNTSTVDVVLRDVIEDDLPILFDFQLDEEANHMAAFTGEDPTDRAAFDGHWERILASERVTTKSIVVGGEVAGHIASFDREGDREVTYWIGRDFWGRGIATAALEAFVGHEQARPLFGRVVKDNAGSIRVLEKCGFEKCGEDAGFANARGEEVEEFVFRLDR